MYKQFKLQNMDNNRYVAAGEILHSDCNTCNITNNNAVLEPVPIRHEMRDITISPLNYGFIVKIGCSQFAIETKEKLVEKLSEYIMNPSEKENNWREKGLI
jgi:hypothetical protein